jgi:GNAT superfamily N-acetyltransferase
MSNIVQRAASLNDIKDIWGLMKQSASDIPFDVESEVEQEGLLTEVMACCTAGMSPLVVDEKQEVVGVFLAKRDDFDWGFRNAETINVSVAAVAPSYRDRGVLKMLIEGIIKRNAPVYVGVRTGDGNDLAAELERSGFSRERDVAKGQVYKWEPVAQS